MSSVPSEVSKYMGNAVKLSDIWGSILYNVKAYGAKGDGVTDDTNAIKAAITAAGGYSPIYFPAGKYKITSKLQNLTNKPIILVGEGSMGNPNNSNNAAFAPETLILWYGPVDDMVYIKGIIGGCRIQGISFEGMGVAKNGLVLDTVQFSKFSDISVTGCTVQGIWINTVQGGLKDATDPSVNSMWNVFEKISMCYVPKGFMLDGNPLSGSNTCHNTFDNITIIYSGPIAFHYNSSDNNTVTHLITFGAGYAVQIEAISGVEYVYHLHGTANGIAGNNGLFIFGYDRTNGQVAPSGANISYFETGLNARRSVLQKPIVSPTNDSAITIQGRTITYDFSTKSALPVNAATVLPINGASNNLLYIPMAVETRVVGISLSFYPALTAGTVTINIQDNSSAVWSITLNIPADGNRFFNFKRNFDVASTIVVGHILSVELVTSATFAPSTAEAHVSLICAI